MADLTPLPPGAGPSFNGRPDSPAPVPTVTWVALATGVIAIAGVVGLAWQSQSRDEAVQQAMGSKVAALDRQLVESTALTKRLQAQVVEAQNRLEAFEAKLADTQTQRIALEEMYRELSRAPDDWLLAEVEQTLNIAAQQLALAGNVKAAIGALQSVDARLARADKLQTAALRRAINADLERLKSLPWVDLTGMTVKLDALVNQIDSLPLATGAESILQAQKAAKAPPQNWASRVAGDAWDELRELIRIRKVGSEESGLITPNQAYFLRENLKLRLFGARMALLARDEASYREDLKLARTWISKYFDSQAKPTLAAQASLKSLQDSALNIALPDLNQSVNAIRAARAAREKGVAGGAR